MEIIEVGSEQFDDKRSSYPGKYVLYAVRDGLTHTHVGTVDTRILPKGTAYVTDVGMTGPVNSVIGSDSGAVLERFLTAMPHRLQVAGGPTVLNSVLVDIDPESGIAQSIQRLDRMVE